MAKCVNGMIAQFRAPHIICNKASRPASEWTRDNEDELIDVQGSIFL